MRDVPEPLYSEVLRLSLAIVNAVEAANPRKARGAYRQLGGLYRPRQKRPDPFLTETLADFTGGARAAAKLYRLSLEQSRDFPGEVAYTKLISLAGCLVRLGRIGEAQAAIVEARIPAECASDSAVIEELREVERACAKHLGVAS